MNKKILIPITLLLLMITVVAYSYDNGNDHRDTLYTWFLEDNNDGVKIKKQSEEALDEFDQLVHHYEDNIIEIHGKVKVVRSAADELSGADEERFEIITDKANYQMKHGTSEIISNDKEIILVDHDEKIIFLSPVADASTDKAMPHVFLSLSSLKDYIETIEVKTKDHYKVLGITTDAAHNNSSYEIVYDPILYTIKTIKISTGYPVPALSEAGGDSIQLHGTADSLILITSAGEEFNTGHMVIQEQLLVEVQYLRERKLNQQDFKATKYIERLDGKCQLTTPYNDYRLVN